MVADLPAAEGAVEAGAIERVADSIPASPEDDEFTSAEARRADAVVALAQGTGEVVRMGDTGDTGDVRGVSGSSDRTTVVIHVPTAGTHFGSGAQNASSEPREADEPMVTHGFRIEGGGIVPPETLARLVCSARVQAVIEDEAGDVVRLGRISRDPPAWMVRQLRLRDQGCVFPGCGARRFAQARHVRWWSAGGRTELRNLVLLCTTHHKLVHEFGWSLTRRAGGTFRWYRPDGRRYRAGPSPPAVPPHSNRSTEHSLLDLMPA
jgi:hypothetical protein